MTRVKTKKMTARGRYDRSLSTEQRHQQQRERLLEAATTELAAHGTATTVAHIIDRAQMSRRTYYQHFRDVEDILEQVYERASARALTAAAAPLAATEDPLEAIRAGIAAYVEIVITHRDAARVVFHHYRRAGPRQEERYQRDTERYAAVLSAALSSAHELGMLGRAPSEMAVFVLVQGIEAAAVRLLAEPDEHARAVADELANLVIAAFR